MSNVYEFKRRKASGSGARNVTAPAEGHGDNNEGAMVFTVNGNESRVKITGVYEQRLQFGIYTMIKGLSAMADKLVANGGVGHYAAGPVNERLPLPQRLPKRLREVTGWGGLD